MSYQPSYDISAVVRGPGHLFIADSDTGAVWTTSCTVTPEETLFGVPVAGFGDIDSRRGDLILRIACEGAGRLTADIVAFLWGFGSLRIGQLMPQRSVWIKAVDGSVVKIENAYVSQPPALNLGANTVTYGSFELVGLLKAATAREEPGSLFTESTEAFTAVPAEDEMPSLPVQASWATAPATAVRHDTAWTVDFSLELETKAPADVGTIGAFVTGVGCTARCTPFGMGTALLKHLALQGEGAGIGRSRPGYDLTLRQDHPGLTVVLKNAKLSPFALNYVASGADRVGELTFTAYRGSGSAELFTVAQSAEG